MQAMPNDFFLPHSGLGRARFPPQLMTRAELITTVRQPVSMIRMAAGDFRVRYFRHTPPFHRYFDHICFRATFSEKFRLRAYHKDIL
jgi:hypothetical protein